jgi:streptogramin lyase
VSERRPRRSWWKRRLWPSLVVVVAVAIAVAGALGLSARNGGDTPRLARTIPLGPRLGVPAAGFGSIWVPSGLKGTLYRIDPDSGRVQARIETGFSGYVQGGSHDQVVVGAGSVWYGSHDRGYVARIDPGTNRVTKRLNVGATADLIAAGGRYVWDAEWQSQHLRLIDPVRGGVRASISAAETISAVAYSGGAVWALDRAQAGDRIVRLDERTRKTRSLPLAGLTKLEPADTYGHGAMTAFKGVVWIGLKGGVLAVNGQTGKLVHEIRLPGSEVVWLAGGGARMYAVDRHRLYAIDVASGKVERAEAYSPGAENWGSIAVSDGSVWVAGWDTERLFRYSFD